MNLYEQIKNLYPELTDIDFTNGTIVLQNDSDSQGDYIKEWNYNKPLKQELNEYLK